MSRSEGRTAAIEEVELPPGPFRPRSTVLAARVHDEVILLDRAKERYLTLNHVAADIWDRLASGAKSTAIVEGICAEYDVPREKVMADVAMQIEEFRRHGLIEPEALHQTPISTEATPRAQPAATAGTNPSQNRPPAATRSLRLPSYFRCALVITEVKLRLALQGYGRTLAWIRLNVQGIPSSQQASMEAVQAAEYRVAMVAAFYPGRAQCLERSLALYILLRRRGIAVRYCQGVQPYPFQAHAWIEYRGDVINDVSEHASPFARLPEQLP